jgi:mycothiol system anti-sigma-R factor
LLHGYLDGELDPMRAEEFERHLESCSQCIAQLGEQESLRASLHRAMYERTPAGLSTKIKRQIASAEAESDDQWS